MIIKECIKSLRLRKLQALLWRLPLNHPARPIIEADFAKKYAGFRGEKSLEYFLKLFPPKNYHVFYGIRLANRDLHFQLDLTVLSSRFLAIFEVKNWLGTLFFNTEHKQVIRDYNGKTDCFPCPTVQLYYQHMHYTEWLAANKFATIPIESQVIISNPSSIIKTTSKINVIHSNLLPIKIEQYERKHQSDILSQKELKRLSTTLLKKHNEDDTDILQFYKLNSDDLVSGIRCPNCNAISMVSLKNFWICKICDFRSKSVYEQSLEDYALLLNPTVTNKHLRNFLHIPSRSKIVRILNTTQLPKIGQKKGVYYDLSTFRKR